MIFLSDFVKTDLFHYITLPIIYIIIGYSIFKLLKTVLHKIFQTTKHTHQKNKRLETLQMILENFLKYFIIIIVVLTILSTYHVDVKSIIAGLGIGVAIAGLAFQDILKDILAGISIVVENQFEIGDDVEIAGFRGKVTFMGLKTTRIQNYQGAVKIISNHNITEVINYSLNSPLALIELPVRYESDLEKLEKALSKIAKKIENTYQNLKGPVQVLGVDRLDESSVVYKISVLTEVGKQFQIERDLKRDYKIGLEKAGFSIPYPQVEVHYE